MISFLNKNKSERGREIWNKYEKNLKIYKLWAFLIIRHPYFSVHLKCLPILIAIKANQLYHSLKKEGRVENKTGNEK